MTGVNTAIVLSSACVRLVELGHEFTVGGACGGEVVVAFFELEAQFYGLLLQMSDLLVEGVDVGGRRARTRARRARRAVRTVR